MRKSIKHVRRVLRAEDRKPMVRAYVAACRPNGGSSITVPLRRNHGIRRHPRPPVKIHVDPHLCNPAILVACPSPEKRPVFITRTWVIIENSNGGVVANPG